MVTEGTTLTTTTTAVTPTHTPNIAQTPIFMGDGITVSGTRTPISTTTDVDVLDVIPAMSDQLLPSLSNLTFNDIFLVGMGEYVFVIPKTAAGMMWLQTHFDKEEWENLSESSVTVSIFDAETMVDDARQAGLSIYYD